MTSCIVAAISCSKEEGGGCNYWRNASERCSLSVAASLAEENPRLRIITSAHKDSSFVRQLKNISSSVKPDIRLDEVPVVVDEIKDCESVFLLTDTDYTKDNPVKHEVEVGRAVVDACFRCKTPHLVYCTKMHVYASVGLRCDACDAKAHIGDYITSREVPNTKLVVPFFYEDFLDGIFKPVHSRKNIFKSVSPMGHIPVDLIGLKDVGICVKNLLRNPKNWIGKTITLSGSKMTNAEYTQMLTDVTYPAIIKDGHVTPDEFMELNVWEGSEDLSNYFDYLIHQVQRNNITTTQMLNEDLESFYDWTRRQKVTIQQTLT